jgi:perosamine synthetase
MDPHRRYWHDILGFNYRMTNIQAAIGVKQLKKLDTLIFKKRRIAQWYREELKDLETEDLIKLHPEMDWAKNVYWMYSILIQESFSLRRDELIKELYRNSIETRPFFNPIHKFPHYGVNKQFPVSEKLSKNGINLPSSANLSKEEVITIKRSLSNY